MKKDTRLETSIAHQSAEDDLDGKEVEVDDGECEAPGGKRAASALSIALANIGKPARLSGRCPRMTCQPMVADIIMMTFTMRLGWRWA